MNQSKLSFWQVLLSILAAAFGVQSEKNQNRDFSHNRVGIYIAGGIIFTALFVIALVLLVKWVLAVSVG